MLLPNGAQIFVETSRGEDSEATAITNAGNLVATVASKGDLVKGVYVIVTQSTWAKMVSRGLIVTAAPETSITLAGIDTSDTLVFPAGGTMSFAKITGWTEIPCVQEIGQDRGEQQNYTYQCLSDDKEKQIPTFKSGISLTYTFAHEFDNPIYPILRKQDSSGQVTAVRMYVPKANKMRMWAGIWSFNDIPSTQVNEMETVQLAVSQKGDFTFVSSALARPGA
ncbi:major tail protein [Shigella phage vB_SflS-ISF001]|uniref:Putative major tail protein n=1 Tax=Shigella phage vB_SflS-ISF001 TaxID=2048005 RepID=A0A2D1GQ14_9CAUD|nr:major tail protein [Shigella phage vB_SflS-ISF001]ATN94107.1 putative major tail protein [Shigella phage vB_SflS-ISF001]